MNPGEETSPPERKDAEASIFSAARMRSHLALTALDEDGELLFNPVLPRAAPRSRKHGLVDDQRTESVARSLLSSRGEVRVRWCTRAARGVTHFHTVVHTRLLSHREKSPQLTHTASLAMHTLSHIT